jgi:hypothetical protein
MRFRRKRVLGFGALLVGLQVLVSLVLMQIAEHESKQTLKA